MSNSSVSNTFETVLNLISLIIDILGLLICLIFLCAIIYRLVHIKYNQGLIVIDIPLILSINIICIIFIKSSLEITHVLIPTLMKDLQIMIEFKETPFYRFRAYMLLSIGCALYWSYVLLAFFRFARVIYPRKLWHHRSTLYLYALIPGLLTCVFIINLPLLFGFNSLHQIPDQAYCGTLATAFAPATYALFSIILPTITTRLQEFLRPYRIRPGNHHT